MQKRTDSLSNSSLFKAKLIQEPDNMTYTGMINQPFERSSGYLCHVILGDKHLHPHCHENLKAH
jgi:hypothetical protein